MLCVSLLFILFIYLFFVGMYVGSIIHLYADALFFFLLLDVVVICYCNAKSSWLFRLVGLIIDLVDVVVVGLVGGDTLAGLKFCFGCIGLWKCLVVLRLIVFCIDNKAVLILLIPLRNPVHCYCRYSSFPSSLQWFRLCLSCCWYFYISCCWYCAFSSIKRKLSISNSWHSRATPKIWSCIHSFGFLCNSCSLRTFSMQALNWYGV